MKVYSNFLSESTISLLNSDIDFLIDKDKAPNLGRCWGASHIHWQDSLFDDISGVCLNATPSPMIGVKLRVSLKKVLPQTNNISINYHYWLPHSGINWHDDGGNIFGATLYLNQWKKEWGGIFLWEDKFGDIRGISPSPGTLVVNESSEPHCVTQISTRAPYPRRSLQIWGKN